MGNTEMYRRPLELAVAICGQKQSINDPESGEDSVQLTSLHQLIQISSFLDRKYYLLF